MCYCIVIDFSYMMCNDSWRRNKTKSKYIRTRRKWSEFILLFIFKELYFSWQLCGKLFSDSHGSCVCVGKREMALVYNWLAVFRLSISAWNTEKQNQYQDLPILLFLVYYSSISLLWLYSLHFCKTCMYIFFAVRFPVFNVFLYDMLLSLPYSPVQYWTEFNNLYISIRYVVILAI
jgi:hypothetical protein